MAAERPWHSVRAVVLVLVVVLAMPVGGSFHGNTTATETTPAVPPGPATDTQWAVSSGETDTNGATVLTESPEPADSDETATRGDETPKRGDNETTETTTVVRSGSDETETETTTDGGGTDKTIDETYTLDRTPSTKGSVQYTYHMDPSDNLLNYTVYLPDGQTVISSTNFTKLDDGGWYWNDSTADGTLVVQADANRTGPAGQDHVDVGEWAFVDWQSYHTSRYYYWYSGGEQPTLQRTFQFERNGILSSEYGYAYFGNYTQTNYQGLVEFRFVDPDSATQASNKVQVMSRLDTIARRFDVGELESPIYIFGPSDPVREGGQASEDEMWANNESKLTDSYDGSVWYEEYVHNRQAFADSNGVFETNMYWIIEGTGVYFRNYFAYRFGDITDDRLHEDVYAYTDQSAVLTSIRYDNNDPAYSKGAHVAMALDLKIRNVTNGQTTLEDVIRRLNTRAETSGDDPINFSEFKTLTEDEVGTSLDSWLEDYVNSSALPTIPTDPAGAWIVDSGAPVAEAGADVTVEEGATVTLDAHASRDPNFEPLSYSWTQTSGPAASITDDGTATPTVAAPQVDSNQTLTLQVSASDDDGNSDTDTVNVTVIDQNEPPTANPVSVTTTEDSSVTGTFDATDPDGDSLSFDIVTGPSNGSASVSLSGNEFLYTPDTGFTGTDSFEYRVTDPSGETDTATVTVTVERTPLDQSWAVESGARTQYATPAIGPERTFVAGLDSTVKAVYRTNGSVDWTFERSGSLSDSAPAYADGTVYVGGGGGTVYALDAVTGDVQWRFETDSAVTSSPVVAGSGSDATVYVGANDGSVYALDATDGTLQWTADVGAPVYGSLAAHPATDTVFVPTNENRLLALNSSDGAERWTLLTDASLGHASPVVADGDLFVAADTVYRIDPGKTVEETSTRWETDVNGTSGSTPTVDSGTVYVGRVDGTVYALDADASGTGSVQWSTDVGGAVTGQPAVVGGRVLVGDHDGTVHMLDAPSGSDLTTASVGGLIRGGITAAGDDIYLGDRTGTVVRLVNVDGELAGGAQSRSIRNPVLAQTGERPPGARVL